MNTEWAANAASAKAARQITDEAAATEWAANDESARIARTLVPVARPRPQGWNDFAL